MIDFDAYTIRIFLHLLGVTVWVGGQIVMAALVPAIRGLGPEATKIAANRFGKVAWPFYALLVATGIWNLFEVDLGSVSTGYHMTLGIKLLLVAASGVAAFVHSATDSKVVMAATGGGGFVAAIGAFGCGVLMVT